MNDVNLAEYLPPFLREYKELKAVMDAENPEFIRLSEATERVLKNEFIETADEFGISRFEKLLGILPSKNDTLESRRARVYSRWFTELPYTLKAFLAKLAGLSEYGNISVSVDFEHYRIAIDTDFELYGQTDELERLVELMFPCNIIADLRNTVRAKSERLLFAGGAVAVTEPVFINQEGV
ncbi:MAG: putative phage tail protein [Oscillospiraceae bacterium]